jgi:hypothetical protein
MSGIAIIPVASLRLSGVAKPENLSLVYAVRTG